MSEEHTDYYTISVDFFDCDNEDIIYLHSIIADLGYRYIIENKIQTNEIHEKGNEDDD